MNSREVSTGLVSETVQFTEGLADPNDSSPPPWDHTFSWRPTQVAFERISPSVGGTSRAWKPFQHFKSAASYSGHIAEAPHATDSSTHGWNFGDIGSHKYPYASYISSDTNGVAEGEFGAPGRLDSGLQELYVEGADGSFVEPAADLDAEKQRALRFMLPGIRAELSLLNSLFELKDIRSLLPTIRRVQSLVALIGSQGSASLRRILRGGSDVHLQTQFNILPLLSDICGIATALHRTEKRLNDLISRSGRLVRRHFTSEQRGAYSSNDVSSVYQPFRHPGDPNWGQAFRVERNVYYEPTIFHAEIEYNFSFTRYQIVHARLLGLLDAFGVNLNPAIIWNAIRWSFVVDWVFGVSRFLNQFAMANMEPQINIRQFLWSVRRARRISCLVKTVSVSAPWIPSGGTPLPVVHQVAYRRDVGLPSISSIQSSGLTPREVSLGAALVFPRRWRPRTHSGASAPQ